MIVPAFTRMQFFCCLLLILAIGVGALAEDAVVRIGDTKTIRVTLKDYSERPIANVKAFLSIAPATRGQITPVDGALTDENGVAHFTFEAAETGELTFTCIAETLEGIELKGKVEKTIEVLSPAVS